MAYMSQEQKSQMAPSIKAVLKKFGMKGSIAVRHHSTLVVNIKSGKIDFGKTDIQVNHHWIDSHYEGVAREFLNELKNAMMNGNHNDSDIHTDYFCVGWYIDINVGKWDQPYIVEA